MGRVPQNLGKMINLEEKNRAGKIFRPALVRGRPGRCSGYRWGSVNPRRASNLATCQATTNRGAITRGKAISGAERQSSKKKIGPAGQVYFFVSKSAFSGFNVDRKLNRGELKNLRSRPIGGGGVLAISGTRLPISGTRLDPPRPRFKLSDIYIYIFDGF